MSGIVKKLIQKMFRCVNNYYIVPEENEKMDKRLCPTCPKYENKREKMRIDFLERIFYNQYRRHEDFGWSSYLAET